MNRTASGGAAVAPDPTGRQRTTTLRRSCEPCRNVKARCIVDPTDTSKTRCCKRCANHGIECVFENALARPKKLKYSARTRVKDVEQKLDGLIALMSARKETAADTPATASGAVEILNGFNLSAAPPAMPHMSFSVPMGINFDFDMPGLSGLPAAPAPAPAPAPAGGHALVTLTGDVIDRGLIQEEVASHLLVEFTQSSEKQFPFVAMPSHATLGYMRRERPHALLAILTVAADAALQIRLTLEYRKALAHAMIVESKSSIDLLQSILIFCIWHQQYFRPYNGQLYQLSQTAVTMAVEINLPNAAAPSLLNLITPAQLKPPPRASCTPTEQMANEVERARTLLGTYCLSASIATAHRKPTHFKYDRQMDQACQYLANAQDRPSDVLLLPYHVQLRKLSEDVDRVFGNLDQGGISLDAAYIETTVKDFERQYEQLRLAIPPQSWSNTALRCAMMFLPVTIYEVALRMPPEHKALLDASPTASCCNWCGSSTRLALLMKCISAAQGYINCYAELPLEEARRVTIVEISRHVDAILVLARAALGFDTKNFAHSPLVPGRASLLDAADVARYLAISEQKMAALVAAQGSDGGGPGQEGKHSLFWQLKHIFQFSRSWYNTRVRTLPGAPKQAGIDSHELAKLDVSSMAWISKGAAMAKAQCTMEQAAPMRNQQSSGSSSILDMVAEDSAGAGRLSGPIAEEVDKIFQSLGVCMGPGPVAPEADTGVSFDAQRSHPSADSTDSMTTSDSSSTAPMVTPESEDSVFDAGDLDPSFGMPNWAMDQSELFANMPQSILVPPWFSF